MLCERKNRDISLRVGPSDGPETCELNLLPLVLILGCLTTCAYRDPQTVFDHAQQILQQGYITTAGKEAEEGYRDFHRVSTEWAWNFTILRARVLLWQGRNDEVLIILASEAAPPASGELAVKKQ